MVRVPIHMLFLCPEGGYSHCGPGLCKGHAAYRVPHPHSFGLTSQGAQASSTPGRRFRAGLGACRCRAPVFRRHQQACTVAGWALVASLRPNAVHNWRGHFRLHPSQGTHASSHAWMALQGGIGGSRQDACFPETPAGMYGCRLGAGGFPSPQCRSQLRGHFRLHPSQGTHASSHAWAALQGGDWGTCRWGACFWGHQQTGGAVYHNGFSPGSR